MDEWENAGRSRPVQIPSVHTNQRRNINKGSKDRTGASTLSHDKASNTMKNNAISFPTKIKVARLVNNNNTALWMWELNVDGGAGIQTFENKCYRRMLGISYREHKTSECVWQQVDILARRRELLLSGVASYHGLATSVVVIRCWRSYYREQWVDGCRRRGRPRKSWKDNIKEWTGWSMSSWLHITDDRGRWAVISADAYAGVPQRRLDVTGISSVPNYYHLIWRFILVFFRLTQPTRTTLWLLRANRVWGWSPISVALSLTPAYAASSMARGLVKSYPGRTGRWTETLFEPAI